LLTRP